MLSATDSFIQYLSTGLAPLRVYFVQATSTETLSQQLKMDALNVYILGALQQGSAERILVSLDILSTEARTALANAKIVRDKLIEQQYTEERDYDADPVSGVDLHRCVSWNGRSINFQIVRNEPHYVHVNATFSISHVR